MPRRALALLAALALAVPPALAVPATAPDHERLARRLSDGRWWGRMGGAWRRWTTSCSTPMARLRGGVVGWGGVLGLGERRAVVPAGLVVLGAADGRPRLAMTRGQLASAPGFERARVAEIGVQAGWGEGLTRMSERTRWMAARSRSRIVVATSRSTCQAVFSAENSSPCRSMRRRSGRRTRLPPIPRRLARADRRRACSLGGVNLH